MTSRLRRNVDFLKLLSQASHYKRKKVYRCCNNDLIICVADCCLNVIKGNVPLDEEDKLKVKRHRKLIRLLAKREIPLKKKREVLIQKGGALTPLLIPILSLAASLLLK